MMQIITTYRQPGIMNHSYGCAPGGKGKVYLPLPPGLDKSPSIRIVVMLESNKVNRFLLDFEANNKRTQMEALLTLKDVSEVFDMGGID